MNERIRGREAAQRTDAGGLRFVLVAGEASGDALGAGLVEELRRRFPDARFAGIGGDAMRAAGVETWHDASELAVMGLFEVLRHLPRLLKLRREFRARALAWRPDVVIGHNLADKHDTHVALALRTIEAIRSLPLRSRPKQFFGGEVWRDLDWMPDHGKTVWDVSAREDLQRALIAVFDSQIGGGKRYDLAVMGRRRAHATYGQSHKVDTATAVALGMDLTPLIRNDRLDPCSYMMRFVDAFRADVAARIARLG